MLEVLGVTYLPGSYWPVSNVISYKEKIKIIAEYHKPDGLGGFDTKIFVPSYACS